jgi:hypothetical protein
MDLVDIKARLDTVIAAMMEIRYADLSNIAPHIQLELGYALGVAETTRKLVEDALKDGLHA